MNFQFSIFNFQFLNQLKKDRGQVVLILVLITVVGLTIGLSLISRTVTDIRMSSQTEQSNRAFSAAEAGVENALKNTSVNPTGTVSFNGVSASFQVTNVGGTTNNLSFPLTSLGSIQSVWMIAHKTDTEFDADFTSYPVNQSFTLCWGSDPSVAKTPAVSLTLLYKDTSVSPSKFKLAKAAFDPAPATRSPRSNFSSPDLGLGSCPSTFKYSKLLRADTNFGIPAANSVLLLMRIQPIFYDTSFLFIPNANLPIQGKLITSVGKTDTGVVRKLTVTQGYPVLPSILDFTLFSD